MSTFWPQDRIVDFQVVKNQKIFTEKCIVAENFVTRLKGLIGRSPQDVGGGMFFPKCNSIHMWFMRTSLDVVFLKDQDGQYTVTSLRPSTRPWRPLPLIDFKAQHVLELPEGSIQQNSIQVGDRLCIA